MQRQGVVKEKEMAVIPTLSTKRAQSRLLGSKNDHVHEEKCLERR